jgi:UPF0755 protein
MNINYKNKLNYLKNKFKNMNKKIKTFILLFFITLFFILIILFWYIWALSPINKDKTKIKLVIPLGSSSSKIATILKNKKVIKNEFAFKTYIKLNKISDLKAGTYSLNKTMSLDEIIFELKNGIFFDPETFNVTFLEGTTIRWYATKIAEVTNNSEQDVFELLKNIDYLKSLITTYWFLTDNIMQDNIYYPLEGYLFPDTYNFKNKDITVKEIFEIMLNQTDKILLNYKKDILSNKYSVHELFTIASIIEMEGMNDLDRSTISSVFYNRLDIGMSLGSDVTTYYAFKIDLNDRLFKLRCRNIKIQEEKENFIKKFITLHIKEIDNYYKSRHTFRLSLYKVKKSWRIDKILDIKRVLSIYNKKRILFRIEAEYHSFNSFDIVEFDVESIYELREFYNMWINKKKLNYNNFIAKIKESEKVNQFSNYGPNVKNLEKYLTNTFNMFLYDEKLTWTKIEFGKEYHQSGIGESAAGDRRKTIPGNI